MTSFQSLRLVAIAPDLVDAAADDAPASALAERSRQLRIGLLENGYNIVAVLPVDTFLSDRLAQLQPDMIILDAESEARDALEHVVMATREARRPIVLFTNDSDTRQRRGCCGGGRFGLYRGRPVARAHTSDSGCGHGAL